MKDRDHNESSMGWPRTGIKKWGLCEDLDLIFSYNSLHR